MHAIDYNSIVNKSLIIRRNLMTFITPRAAIEFRLFMQITSNEDIFDKVLNEYS